MARMVKKKTEEKKQAELPQPVPPPEPTLIDVINKINLLKEDIGVALEAVKALGADVIKNNREQAAAMTDLSKQMANLNTAFVKALAEAPRAAAPTQKAKPAKGVIYQKLRDYGVPQDGLDVQVDANGKITVRLPYLNNKALFGKVRGYLKQFGIEYISDGKNTRFEG